jgi:hypothetical protein
METAMSTRICVLIALATGAIRAQTITTGEIAGTVTDSSSALVTNASVLLKSLDTGESRAALSNAEGMYRFTFVKPGTYEIYSTSAGLTSDTNRVTVAVGQVRNTDLSLKVEGAKSVDVVTDAAPVFDTDNANITYTVSARQLDLGGGAQNRPRHGPAHRYRRRIDDIRGARYCGRGIG